MHFLKRGTLVYIGKKVTAPNGHYPRSSSHWWRDSRFQRHSFFNLRKSSKSCGTIEGGEGNVSFSNLESFSASLYFVISSNRSIERLGFFISVFLFYLHLCFSVYFAKLILFTTIPHTLQKIKHRDEEKRIFWVHLRCNASDLV